LDAHHILKTTQSAISFFLRRFTKQSLNKKARHVNFGP
jgi:hypothetical protein